MATATSPEMAVFEPHSRRPYAWASLLIKLTLILLVVVFVIEFCRVLFGRNLHEVAAGRVYRSSQRDGADLTRLVAQYKIKTVVNLRGTCDLMDWYQAECRAAHELGLSMEDISMSAGRLPSIGEVNRLVEVLDHSEYPIIFHCRRGADRTGLASAIYQLLYSNQPFERARTQLGLRYGHLAIGRTASLDHFLGFYESWLKQQNIPHAPSIFRDWLLHHYQPAECLCEVQALNVKSVYSREERASMSFRFYNRSQQTWHFLPGSKAGDHAWFTLFDSGGNAVLLDRAGMFHRDVPPGGSIDLTVHLAPIVKPGRYRMMVDLCNEQQCSFFQVGSEPLEQEIEVR